MEIENERGFLFNFQYYKEILKSLPHSIDTRDCDDITFGDVGHLINEIDRQPAQAASFEAKAARRSYSSYVGPVCVTSA